MTKYQTKCLHCGHTTLLPVCHPDDKVLFEAWEWDILFECARCEEKVVDLPF